MGWAGKRQVLRWFLRVLRRLALVSVQYFVSCFVLTSVQTMTKEICLKLIVLICINLELEWPLGATQGVNETKPLQQLREVYLLTSRHFLLWLSGGRSLGWTWASNQRLSRFYVQKTYAKIAASGSVVVTVLDLMWKRVVQQKEKEIHISTQFI